MIDLRYIRSSDWTTFLLIVLLSLIGLLTVYSATYRPDEALSLFFKKQVFGVVTGLMLYIVSCYLDYKTFERWGYFLYFGVIALLFWTILKGSMSMGGQRWINLGIFKFQPSECSKLFFAPFLSYYLATEKISEYSIKTFLPILGALALTMLLILKQPDLGTALVILFSVLTLLWFVGISKQFFFACAFISLIMAPLGWHFLKPYQQQRVLVFLGQGDKTKERYQLEQSQIAIGSGGLTGKGFMKGTQNKLHFLPEGRTDFIFSVFCEEWGFLGALCLILLYLLLFLRLFALTPTIKNFYTQVLAVGLTLPLAFSTLINLGMVIGLLPIVGIPLPFMTYGITHSWISYISLGIIQSIMMRRFLITH